MSVPVDRFTDACVRSAARRWPSDISDLMAREWRAELAHARRDPNTGPAARLWRQLAFAMSLAVSPAAGSEPGLADAWRSRLSGLGSGAQRFITLIGIGVLCGILLDDTATIWISASRYANAPNAVRIGGVVVAAITIALMAILARPVVRSGRIRVLGGALAPIPIALGVVIVLISSRNAGMGEPVSVMWSHLRWAWPALGAWSLLAVATVGFMRRARRAGRIRLARFGTVVGLLVAADVAAAIAALPHVRPWSAPGLLFRTVVARGWEPEMHVEDTPTLIAQALILATAFLAGYYLQQPKPTVAANVAAPIPPSRTPIVPLGGRILAAVLGVGGLVAMAYAVATKSADHRTFSETFTGMYMTVAVCGVAVTLFAFVICLAGRAPVALPAVLAGAILLAADRQAVTTHWDGPGAALALGVLGLLVIAGAIGLAARLAGPGTTAASGRRALIVTAVAAAMGVPTSVTFAELALPRYSLDQFMASSGGDLYPPLAIVVLTLIVGGLLVAIALVAAIGSRRRPLSLAGCALVTVVSAGLFVLAAGDPDAARALHYAHLDFFVQPIIAMAVVAGARWDHPVRPLLAGLGWLVAMLLAGVASAPMLTVVYRLTTVLQAPFPGVPYGGTAVAAMLIGLALALAFAHRLVPPESAPAEPDHEPTDLLPVTA